MSASNRAVVLNAFHDGLNKRNLSVIREYYSDAICHLPFGNELTGESLMQFFASLFAAFPDVQRRVDVQFTDGVSHVITRWTATGIHQGEFMGIASTGKQFTISGITIDRIRNGQIVEEWQEWDSYGLMQQLGVVPTLRHETVAA